VPALLRQPAIVVALGILLLAVLTSGLILFLKRQPAVPTLDLATEIDPGVARAIEDAVARVGEDPLDGRRYGELGLVYSANEFFDLARQCYEIADSLDPGTLDWTYLLAIMAAERGKTGEATRGFQKAIRLDPDYAPAYVHLGDALRSLGELDGAGAAYVQYNRLMPGRPWGWIGLGKIARRQVRFDDAVRHLERAFELEPRYKQTSYLLAVTYRALGRNDDAARQLGHFDTRPETMAMQDPIVEKLRGRATGKYGLLNQAKVLLDGGRLERAEALYRKVLRGHPGEYAALSNLGLVYLRQRRHEEAEAVLLEAVAAQPTGAHARATLSRVYLDTHRPEEAEVHAGSAAEHDPLSYRGHYYLGCALAGQQRPQEALEPLRRALEIAPDFPHAHYTLALCHLVLEQHDKAVAELKEVLRIVPDHAEARARLKQLGEEPTR